MNTQLNTTQPPQNQIITRPQLLVLLRTGLAQEAYRFSKQIAISWLAYFPGDLLVSRLLAQVQLQSESYKQASLILNDLIKVDPEKVQNLELFILTSQASGFELSERIIGSAHALGVDIGIEAPIPTWAKHLRCARLALDQHEFPKAAEFIHKSLIAESPPELVGVTHLEISIQRKLPNSAIQDLAAHYYKHWPTCLPCSLIYAEALINGSESEKAVALIHQASVQDVAGEVILRLWGPDHPYRRLWSEKFEAPLDTLIPADILTAIGWNQLSEGKTSLTSEDTEISNNLNDRSSVAFPTHESDYAIIGAVSIQNVKVSKEPQHSFPDFDGIPESLRSIQEELEHVADRLKQNYLARADGRFPVYIVFTTRKGLEIQYGSQLISLENSIQELVSAIRKRSDWGAELIYADDPKIMGVFGLQPAKFDDPWELKLAIVDLDKALAKRGEMIGAVLIIGGPEVVPFHKLPNPVDDNDDDVPSDNPYATRDENYFIPEWLIGRIPGGSRKDIEPIQKILANITARHTKIAETQPWYRRIWNRLSAGINYHFVLKSNRKRPSWGSTAAIWRRASLSVFRPIGPPHAMQVSPPAQVDSANSHDEILPATRLGYFNLHGLPDASEWFGQRDPSEPGTDLDYPVALRPQDVVNGGRAPQIVFSEACYGAHVLGKDIEESLALKFLVSGSHAVVGSTCTSYGSISPPLIAADLLGHTFWKYLRDGLSTGSAFRRAKIQMAREMLHRQGYLDGEDQKTLISFVLYGDPLAQFTVYEHINKSVYRPIKRAPKMRTVCDRASGECRVVSDDQAIPTEVMAQVKHVVDQYLPGMKDAQVSFSNEVAGCANSCSNCVSGQVQDKKKKIKKSGRKVITLSKNVPVSSGDKSPRINDNVLIHRHYARLTLDKYGKLVKLAVSR